MNVKSSPAVSSPPSVWNGEHGEHASALGPSLTALAKSARRAAGCELVATLDAIAEHLHPSRGPTLADLPLLSFLSPERLRHCEVRRRALISQVRERVEGLRRVGRSAADATLHRLLDEVVELDELERDILLDAYWLDLGQPG